MSKPTGRQSVAYWERRLFRNTYTRAGRSHVVSGWCVKIQVLGRRRTWRLAAADREAAALEALGIYRRLREESGGDESVAKGGGAPVKLVENPRRGPGETPASPPVTTRKYVGHLHPPLHRELFATLTAQGRTEHVALGTEDFSTARWRAEELQRELVRHGWAALNRSQAREATIAVFWQDNPMTCTYTTLLTSPARHPLMPVGASGVGRLPARGWRVMVLEAEEDVRRALVYWLGRAAGVAVVEGRSTVVELPRDSRWDLVLANREQLTAATRERLAATSPAPRLLTHGVFADSDAIFASFSGVSLGYLLRRLPPEALLSPLLTAFVEGAPRQAGQVERQISRYFQAMFEPGGERVRLPATAEFTVREREILDLLSRGFADKEIGGELGISVWTVHSHLKRIFAKYGVRTRTEAVVKHLQK